MPKRTSIVLTTHAEFEEPALRELGRLAGPPRLVARLAPGVLHVEAPCAWSALSGTWSRRPPVYAHHVFPVATRLPSFPSPESLLHSLKREIRALRHTARLGAVAVQTRVLGPFPCILALALEESLERLLAHATGLPVDRSRPARVISVVVGHGETLLGVSPPAANLSPWPGGVPPIPPDPARLNRAELKLLEAFELFRARPRPGSRALDLGACPGGWSRILLQHGATVLAVGPGSLAPALQVFRHRLSHRPVTAEEFVRRLPDARFDWIVNDMMLHPADSARALVACAPLLAPDGHALMTIKLGARARLDRLAVALRILRRAFRIPRLRHLHSNRLEVTAWLRPRQGPEPVAGT